MTDEKTVNEGSVLRARKRRALKKVVGIGLLSTAVPGTWIKPVVETIILPTHAQTSGPVANSPASPQVQVDSDGDGVFDEDDRCAGTSPNTPVDAEGCSTVVRRLIIPGTGGIRCSFGANVGPGIEYVVDDSDPSNPVVRQQTSRLEDGQGLVVVSTGGRNGYRVHMLMSVGGNTLSTTNQFDCHISACQVTDTPITIRSSSGNDWSGVVSFSCANRGIQMAPIELTLAS